MLDKTVKQSTKDIVQKAITDCEGPIDPVAIAESCRDEIAQMFAAHPRDAAFELAFATTKSRLKTMSRGMNKLLEKIHNGEMFPEELMYETVVPNGDGTYMRATDIDTDTPLFDFMKRESTNVERVNYAFQRNTTTIQKLAEIMRTQKIGLVAAVRSLKLLE